MIERLVEKHLNTFRLRFTHIHANLNEFFINVINHEQSKKQKSFLFVSLWKSFMSLLAGIIYSASGRSRRIRKWNMTKSVCATEKQSALKERSTMANIQKWNKESNAGKKSWTAEYLFPLHLADTWAIHLKIQWLHFLCWFQWRLWCLSFLFSFACGSLLSRFLFDTTDRFNLGSWNSTRGAQCYN